MLCDDLEGWDGAKEAQEGWDIYILTADSHCTVETNTTL